MPETSAAATPLARGEGDRLSAIQETAAIDVDGAYAATGSTELCEMGLKQQQVGGLLEDRLHSYG